MGALCGKEDAPAPAPAGKAPLAIWLEMIGLADVEVELRKALPGEGGGGMHLRAVEDMSGDKEAVEAVLAQMDISDDDKQKLRDALQNSGTIHDLIAELHVTKEEAEAKAAAEAAAVEEAEDATQ
jgi:hypothetical protein